MSTSSVENVVIIGTGCAGLTAAIYTARANLNPLVLEGPLPGQIGYRLFPTNIQIPVGRWVHVETRYKSAGDFTGAIQTWVDGVEILNMQGVRTRYPDGDTQWSVTSYAQGLSPAPAVIYVDDVVISQTRSGP